MTKSILLCLASTYFLVQVAAAAPQTIQTLNLSAIRGFQFAHPIHQFQEPNNAIRALFAPPFLYQDDQGRWQCNLCTALPEWPEPTVTKDKEKDKKDRLGPAQQTFQIANEWAWSNGNKVTAADVKATIEVLKRIHPDPRVRLLYPLVEIKLYAQDSKRFTVTYRRPSADWPKFLSFSLLPASEVQPNLSDEAKFSAWIEANKLGSETLSYGPYRVTNLNNTQLSFELNPNYSKAKPFFTHVTINDLRDEAEATRQMNANLTEGILDHQWQVLPSFSANVYKHYGDITEMLLFNLKNPGLNDTNLRRGFSKLINRDIFENLKISSDATSKDFLQRILTPNDTLAYNRGEAHKFLNRAGWTLEKGALHFTKRGQNLNLVLTYNRSAFRQKFVERLQQGLSKEGIEMTLDGHDDASFVHEVVEKSRFRDMLLLAVAMPLPSGFHDLFHSSQVINAANNFQGQNLSNWIDKQTDDPIELLEVATQQSEQEQHLNAINVRLVDQVPAIPLFQWTKALVLNSKITGALMPGRSASSTIFIDRWRR